MGNAKKVKKERTKSDIWYTVLAIVIGVCLLFGLGVAIMQPTGLWDYIVLHTSTAMKTDHYSLSNAQFKFLTYSYYQNVLSQMGSSSSSISEENKQYYLSMCKSYVQSAWENVLPVCEAARAAGYSLTEEDKQSVNKQMEEYAAAAKAYNTSVGALFGSKGITNGDIKSTIELQTLASSYTTKLKDEFKYTDEQLTDYYNENKTDFSKADYYSYTLKAEYESDASDDAKEQARTDAKNKALQLVNKIEGGQDFVAVITEYKKELAQANVEAAEKALQDSKKDAADTAAETAAETTAAESTETEASETESEPADTAEAEKSIEEMNLENAKAALEAITEDSVKATILTEGYKASAAEDSSTKELDEWIFAESPAQNGSTKMIPYDGGESVVIYQIVKSEYKEDYKTVTIHELGISGSYFEGSDGTVNEDALKECAEKIVNAFNNGSDKSAEAFDKLAETNSDDSVTVVSYGQAKEVSKSSSSEQSAKDVDEWLFSEERKAGDVKSFVINDTNSTTGAKETHGIIIFFEETGREKWICDVESAMKTKDLNAKTDEFKQTYKVTTNEKAINKI